MSSASAPIDVNSNGSHFNHSTPPTLHQSRIHNRAIARGSRENFIVVSLLLPRRYRQAFYDLYAYCRTADDLADASPDVESAMRGLDHYRDQIDRIFSSSEQPNHPIFVALAETVAEFNLPRQPFDDLLDAFVQDQTVDRYDTMQQVFDYCRCSADPVGRLILALAGIRDAERIGYSDRICTALQLTNFWQDMRRDFQNGRIYLPAETMRQHGFDEKDVAAGVAAGCTPDAIRGAVAERCQHAAALFAEGHRLVECVPNWLAGDIRLFIRGGEATLDAIAGIHFDVLARRVTVGKVRRLGWFLRALLKR